jgi:hypothetical protein
MAGVLVARGPTFREGVSVGPVENVHVYSLLAHALGIQPAQHDGDFSLVKAFFREP